MQIGLKSEENETRNAGLVWVTLSLSCTKSARVWYFALGGKKSWSLQTMKVQQNRQKQVPIKKI